MPVLSEKKVKKVFRRCDMCGLVFALSYKQKWRMKNGGEIFFCSRLCSIGGAEAKKKLAEHFTHRCDHCGDLFSPTAVQRYNLRNKSRKAFCSLECYKSSRIEDQGNPENYKACDACGKKFRMTWNQKQRILNGGGGTFTCSKSCRESLCDGAPPAEMVKKMPKIPAWIPYSGVGAMDFQSLNNPF